MMSNVTRNYRLLLLFLLIGLVILLLVTGLALTANAGPLAAPLLGVDIAVSSSTTTPGGSLVYTATTNNPQGFSVSAEVSLPLPAQLTYSGGLTYSLAGTASYNTATGSVAWEGLIPAGETLSLSYAGTVANPLRNGTVITGLARVNDYFNPVYTDTVTTTVQSEPDLSPSWKTVTPAQVLTAGQVVTTVLHLENSGNDAAHVYLTETVPSCFSLGGVSAQDIVIGPDYINWDFDLAAGGVHTLTYQATAQADCLQGGTRQVILSGQVNDSQHPPFNLDAPVQFGEIGPVFLPVILNNYTPPCDAFEPNDTFTQATTIGTASRQVFSYDGDVDYLAFEVTQPNTYTVQTGSLGPDTDTILYLFDQNQTLLDWNDDAASGTLWSRVGPVYLNAGRYYLKVEDYNPHHYGCGHSYDVEVH